MKLQQAVKNLLSKRRRLLRGIGIALVLLIVAVYIGLPTIMAVSTILPDQSTPGELPAGFVDLTLTTGDGVQLAAWYAEPQNGAVIILAHGSGRGREGMSAYAAMLHRNGFGVLALNMRGYGDSEGRINRLGWNGTRDVGAAIDYLIGRDEVTGIGGLGLSMGGEILLGATSAYPALRAIVADGATYRSVNEYTALPANRSLYRNFTTRVFSFMVSVFSGDDQPDPPLLESIRDADTTSFLFIAAGKSDVEIAFNELFHQTASDRSNLWIIPGIGHTGGFSHDPEAYERRVVDFFRTALLEP